MKESRVRSALEAIASRGIPEKTDVWPELEARLNKGAPFMRLQTKWGWSVLLVLLALALLSTVAYALYRIFSDPGLRSAQEAGLITDVNSTAESSRATAQSPFVAGSGNATLVGTEQTIDNVTVGLDWVYLEDARQAFHVAVRGLTTGTRLGMPALTYADVMPEGYAGATFTLRGEDPLTGTYLANQFVRPEGQPGGKVDLKIEIPLEAWIDGQSTPLGVFRFDVKAVDITVPWGGGGGDTYAVRVNGLEMRLDHAVLAPDYTLVRLCYQLPDDQDWVIDDASLQFADPMTNIPGPAVAMDAAIDIREAGQQPCEDIDFPAGAPAGDANLLVTAKGLVVRGGSEKIDSAWQFNHYVPMDLHIGGTEAEATAAQTPLASETVGELMATLQWAYVDSNRLAFKVHFSTWQPDFAVTDIALLSPDGTNVNVGAGWGPAEEDPATVMINLTPARALQLEQFAGQLVLGLTTSREAGAPTSKFVFDLDLPVYQAVILNPNLTETANGRAMVLQTIKMTPSYTVAYLCYEKPTPGDWMIGDGATLRIGADQSTAGEYAMMYDSDYGDVGKGLEPGWKPALEVGRCVRIGFPVGHHDQPETLVLTIAELQQSTPEVFPEQEVRRALAQLRTEGIEMDWMTFSGGGGGGATSVFKKLPAGMTEQEAYRRFLDAMGYIRKGPWVFTVDIAP